MYEDYFGLDRPPFKITPDTSLFYDGGKRGDILAALTYAIHRGEGIIKVVGEVGSGKTMLCRMLQLKLPETVEIVYIANPSVSAEDILFVIAHELSLPVGKDASKHEVMHLLQDYLLQRHMENKQVVLFVEEAQGMPIDTLEEIRLLSNLETDENKLLQIVLFGQPELDDNLSEQSIRQLRERITHNFNLEPLSHDEIHNYLNFRMREVGYTGPELINSTVARKVEQHSEGLLRRINIIADKILLSAFAEGTHNLGPKHVTAAVNDSAFSQQAPRKSRSIGWLVLLVLAAIAFGLYQTRAQWMPIQVAELAAAVEDTALNLAPAAENAALNDKPITDIESREVETGPLKAPLEVAATPPVEVDTTPQVKAVETATQAVDVAAQTAVAEVLETETLKQQVDAVVQQVEAAVQQAADTKPPVANAAESDPVLKSALDQAASSEALATRISSDLSMTSDYNRWLDAKLQQSRDWLSNADRDKVSIQVLVRSKSAVRELVYYLRNDWPLEISKTYLYEVSAGDRNIYRVFYSEFDTLSSGRNQLELLPDSVKSNSPYLHSVHRMQKALL